MIVDIGPNLQALCNAALGLVLILGIAWFIFKE